MPKTLDILLDIFSQAMGSPVEIEFSLNIENQIPTLYLLQIKPLIKTHSRLEIDQLPIDTQRMLMRVTKGMGNGKIENIRDVIYIDPDKFNRLKTEEIA